MWWDWSIITGLKMLPNEVFRNILFDDRSKYQHSGGNYCEGNLKAHIWFWSVRIFPFWSSFFASLALKDWMTSPCTGQSIVVPSSVLMDRLCDGMTSCESESTDSPPFFYSLEQGLSSGPGFKTSRLVCGSHKHLLQLPLTHIGWESGLFLAFWSRCRIMAKGQC